MTTDQFRKFKKTGNFAGAYSCKVGHDDRYVVTPNLACSIEELMIRQSQGLPMPNLTPVVHTAFNGYDIDNLPVSARKGADVIDVMREIKDTKESIKKTERAYRKDIEDAIKKIGENTWKEDNKN